MNFQYSGDFLGWTQYCTTSDTGRHWKAKVPRRQTTLFFMRQSGPRFGLIFWRDLPPKNMQTSKLKICRFQLWEMFKFNGTVAVQSLNFCAIRAVEFARGALIATRNLMFPPNMSLPTRLEFRLLLEDWRQGVQKVLTDCPERSSQGFSWPVNDPCIDQFRSVHESYVERIFFWHNYFNDN